MKKGFNFFIKNNKKKRENRLSKHLKINIKSPSYHAYAVKKR